MVLPLASLRVLGLSNVLAGPFCGYQLGLLGVEVIKIEVPGNGDLARRLRVDSGQARRKMGAPFTAVNMGKQPVTANLKHPEGRTILLKLVVQAGALIEDYHPGAMDHLELDYDVLYETNPCPVYCVISDFSKGDPPSDGPAYDQIIQGTPGVMSVAGDGVPAPLRMGYPVSDTVDSVTTVLTVTTCLLDTQRTGQGCMVDISMLGPTLATMGWVVSDYLNAGVAPHPMGNQNLTAALFGTFRTNDGLINIAANKDKQFTMPCRMVGHPELAADARFVEYHARKEHRQQLNGALEVALAARLAAEREPLLIGADAPIELVLDVPGVLAYEQVMGRGFVAVFLEAGQHVMRARFCFSGENPCPQTPTPILSTHTDDWLTRLGCRHGQIEALRTEDAI